MSWHIFIAFIVCCFRLCPIFEWGIVRPSNSFTYLQYPFTSKQSFSRHIHVIQLRHGHWQNFHASFMNLVKILALRPIVRITGVYDSARRSWATTSRRMVPPHPGPSSSCSQDARTQNRVLQSFSKVCRNGFGQTWARWGWWIFQ